MIKIDFIGGISHFNFIPDEGYAPVTVITCVGIDNSGRRFESERLVNLEQLPNNIEINILTPLVEPGMNASLRVTSAMHSTVSLLAIDQSEILISTKSLKLK